MPSYDQLEAKPEADQIIGFRCKTELELKQVSTLSKATILEL